MTPATIIQGAQAEGVRLTLSSAGNIKVIGDGAAVSRWQIVIREHKAAIIEALKVAAGDMATSVNNAEKRSEQSVVVANSGKPIPEKFKKTPENEVSKEPVRVFDTSDAAIQADIQKNLSLIKEWLFSIGEPEEDHYIVLDKCRNNAEAMVYFLRNYILYKRK